MSTIVNLRKGESISLRKTADVYRVGVAWVDKSDSKPVDIDVYAMMLDKSGYLLNSNPQSLIFYSNLRSVDGSITHTGDDRSGGADTQSDNESIEVLLKNINPDCQQIVFFASAYKSKMADVRDLRISVYEGQDQTLISNFNTTDVVGTVFEIARIERDAKLRDAWEFKAIGKCDNSSLAEYLVPFGISAEE